jgi:hypothetical protein
VPIGRPESIGPGAWGRCFGDSAGSRPEEALALLWPEAARVGEGGAPPVLGEPCTSFGLGGFKGSGIVFSA